MVITSDASRNKSHDFLHSAHCCSTYRYYEAEAKCKFKQNTKSQKYIELKILLTMYEKKSHFLQE